MSLLSISGSVTSSSAEGRMCSVQTSSEKADIPFQLQGVYLRKPLFRVLTLLKVVGSVGAEIASKVRITGLASFNEGRSAEVV